MSETQAIPKSGSKRALPGGRIVLGKALHPALVAQMAQARAEHRATPGATWGELHTRYLNWTKGSDWQWLMADFIPRIRNAPNGKCGGSCRHNFRLYVFAHPIDWRDPFPWTVAAHNAVNLKLNKPGLLVEAARLLWSQSVAKTRH